jgi:hypothetical protein
MQNQEITPESIKRLCPDLAYMVDVLFSRQHPSDLKTIRVLQALAEARQTLESQKDIVDAAIDWQSYWYENIGDKDGISRRQGYLYDRVRYYRKRTQPPKEGG